MASAKTKRWSEPVKNFLKDLEKHAKVRFPKGERNELNPDLNEADEDVTYWVCTPGGMDPNGARKPNRRSRSRFQEVHIRCPLN